MGHPKSKETTKAKNEMFGVIYMIKWPLDKRFDYFLGVYNLFNKIRTDLFFNFKLIFRSLFYHISFVVSYGRLLKLNRL